MTTTDGLPERMTWHLYARTFGNCYVTNIEYVNLHPTPGHWLLYLPEEGKTAMCDTLDDARKLAAEHNCGIIL